MATKVGSMVMLVSLLVIFLGSIFWGIFAPLIIASATTLNESVGENCATCVTLLAQVPLFTVLGYWLFIIGGVLGVGFGGFLMIKGV